ncbi:hypothetical protein [Haloechinothrix alba]|nr:hypothetical protein [Haloechinothrix alba]
MSAVAADVVDRSPSSKSTKRKFLVGYLLFSIVALMAAWLTRNFDPLPTEIHPHTRTPAIPGNDTFSYNRRNTIIAVILLGAVGLTGTVFAVRELIRRKRLLPLMVSLSALMLIFPEVAVDVIGKVYYPTDDVDNIITIFGRQMGMFLFFAFFGYGVFNFLTFRMLERRPTTRMIWLLLLTAAAGAIVFEEVLQWAGGMYHYYADQPLRFLYLPQWWTPANTIGVAFLPAVIAYRFRERFRGWRALLMFLVTPCSMMSVYGAIALPSWVVINGRYPWVIDQLAGLLTIAFGIVLAVFIIRILLQRDPFDLTEPATLTDDPALDPCEITLRTTNRIRSGAPSSETSDDA